MLPLLMAAGMAAMQAKQAKDAKDQAGRQSMADALQESGQTAYSGFTGGPAGKIKAWDAGPSVGGAALSGAVGGFSQGQGFQTASAQNAYSKLLQDQQLKNNIVQPQGGANAYQNMQGGLGLPTKGQVWS